MLLFGPLETVGGIWLAISAIAFILEATGFLIVATFCLIGLVVILPRPAKGADFGDCCADLEERVAELEATTVRKGNKRVSVQLYGKVNRAVLFWDDGAEQNTYVVDNHYESSRFGLIGSAAIGGDWSAGYRLEIENLIARSTALNQFNDNAVTSPLNVRWSSMYLNHKKWGELRWGLTATPKYDVTKDTNVFSPNLIDTTSSDNRMNQSFRLRPKGFDNAEGLSGLTWSNIGRCYSSSEAFNCSTRRNGVAYWSPKWHGFSGSWGWFEDDDWGAALRYKDEWGETFLVGAGIGYENFRDERLQSGGGGVASGPNPPFPPPNNTTFFQRNFDEWAGMANIKHKPTGLFAFTAFSFSDSGDTNAQGIFTKKGPPDMNGWDVQVGIQRKMSWFGLDRLGETSFWGGYANIHDGIAQGSNGNGGNLGGIPANAFLAAGTFANVPVNTQIVGSDVDRWFLAADQWIDSAAIQLYAVYQHLSADVSLVDQDLKHVPAPLDDFDAFYTGAIIYF